MLTNSLQNDTLCNGEQTQAVIFTGSANFFEWIASRDIIENIPKGIQTGYFGEYIVENKGNTPLTTLITVMPKYVENGKTCIGADTSFSITVYPVPTLTNSLQNDTLCDGEQTKAIVFTGADFYEWTATGTVLGIPANGTGDFGEYTVSNKTTNPIKSIITVTPKYTVSEKGCEGISKDFEIVVNHTTQIHSLLPDANALFLCGEEEVRLEVNASGENLVYQWYHNGNLLQGEQNEYFLLPAVSEANSGEYYVEVSGACGDAKSRSVTIGTENVKVLVWKWNEEIYVDDPHGKYAGFQWYKNGTIIPAATKGSYQEKGGLNGCYSVELKFSDGRKIHSCERCFDKAKKYITLYPNPAKAGEIIRVHFNPSGNVNFLSVELFNASGQLISEKQVNSNSFEVETIYLAPGVYVLKVISEDYWVYYEKVIVY
jgi:hypothetical protein